MYLGSANNLTGRIPLKMLGTLQEAVSVQMVVGQSKMYFRDIPNLQVTPEYDLQINSIETFSSNYMPLDPEARAVAGETCVRNSYLFLKIRNEEVKSYEPLITFCTNLNNGIIRQQKQQNIDWEKSYVYVNDPALLTSGGVYFFSIGYTKIYKS